VEIGDIRAMLAGIDEYAYFQTSGFSPKPQLVIDEVVRWLRFQARGPALPHIHEPLAREVEQTRARLARAIGAEADEIALAENATVGINIVANGIDWHPGDSVVLSTHEHPGNRVVWYELSRRSGVRLRFLEIDGNDDGRLLAELERLLEPRTRIVSLSHVSRRNGRRLPAQAIVALAHRRGVPVLLDGAQAFGSVPVDVRALGCDFYVLSGHKYILGPQATGAFFVRRDRIDWLRPSWLGSRSQQWLDQQGGMALHQSARRFEFGTRNMADIAGLGRALDLWEEVDWETAFAAIAAYAEALRAALAEMPGLVVETPEAAEQRAGIVTFRIPGVPGVDVYRRLLEQERILVSPFEPGTESVRVSIHVFNTDAERERLVSALRHMTR
jgi:selenocysteine lyase/cysteine desulfurase